MWAGQESQTGTRSAVTAGQKKTGPAKSGSRLQRLLLLLCLSKFRLRYVYRPDVETFCAVALALGTLTYPLTVSLPTLLITISSGIFVPAV